MFWWAVSLLSRENTGKFFEFGQFSENEPPRNSETGGFGCEFPMPVNRETKLRFRERRVNQAPWPQGRLGVLFYCRHHQPRLAGDVSTGPRPTTKPEPWIGLHRLRKLCAAATQGGGSPTNKRRPSHYHFWVWKRR